MDGSEKKGSLKAPPLPGYVARDDSAPTLADEVRQLRLDLPDVRAVVAAVIQELRPQEADAVTLNDFWERWIREYAKANRQKPRGVESKVSDLKLYWLPRLGSRPLNKITDEDIAQFKADCEEDELDPKTVNNKLSTLNKLLKTAVDWKSSTRLHRMPVTIKMLRIAISDAEFYDFDQWAHLVRHAQRISAEVLCVVLLGGDAGYRRGEIIAGEWNDWAHGQLHIQRSESRGHVTLPKSGKGRRVRTTEQLEAALNAMRSKKHKGERMLCHEDGTPFSEQHVRTLFAHAQKAAGFKLTGLHILRHTFCSHLAMRGAPARAIQANAGHASMRTTERYMHLSPAVGEAAIKLLDSRPGSRVSGLPDHFSMTLPGFENGLPPVPGKTSKKRRTKPAGIPLETRQGDALAVWLAELGDAQKGGRS